MDMDDKLDFIAAILASGSSGNEGAPAQLMLKFRIIREQLQTEGLDGPRKPSDGGAPRRRPGQSAGLG